MSGEDRKGSGRIDRDVRRALDRTAAGVAGAQVLRRIRCRSPVRIVEEGRIRSLRSAAAAATVVLGALFSIGDPAAAEHRLLQDTSLSAVVAIDVFDFDELQHPSGLIGDLFAVEVPE